MLLGSERRAWGRGSRARRGQTLAWRNADAHRFAPQHFLCFRPDPHGQGSLRPTRLGGFVATPRRFSQNASMAATASGIVSCSRAMTRGPDHVFRDWLKRTAPLDQDETVRLHQYGGHGASVFPILTQLDTTFVLHSQHVGIYFWPKYYSFDNCGVDRSCPG
jgi:hypothetical protein